METWMPFFVVLTAIAIVVQAIVLIALFLQVRRTAAQVERLTADLNVRLGPILTRVQILVDEVAPRLTGMASDAAEFTRLARSQAQKVDRLLTESMERLRIQLVHVDNILTGLMEAVELVGSGVKRTVWSPMVKAAALVRGIQSGLEFYRSAKHGGDRRDPSSESQDQGMFI